MRAARIRIVVASHIRLTRDGVAQLLRRNRGLHVVALSATVAEAVLSARINKAVLLLVDAAMPDCCCGDMMVPDRTTPVVLYGLQNEDDVFRCTDIGAIAYVSGGESVTGLVDALVCAFRHELRCPADLAPGLIRRMRAGPTSSREVLIGSLTTRQRQVLPLIASGLSNKEIGKTLGIELSTVKNHVHAVMRHLHMRRRSEVRPTMATLPESS
jgi:DNA-binding NarL/FixJ family response regulator